MDLSKILFRKIARKKKQNLLSNEMSKVIVDKYYQLYKSNLNEIEIEKNIYKLINSF